MWHGTRRDALIGTGAVAAAGLLGSAGTALAAGTPDAGQVALASGLTIAGWVLLVLSLLAGAAAVFLPLAAVMSEDSFNSWGWRIPFLMSAFVIIAGWYIRRSVEESPAFVEELEEGQLPESPIVGAFRHSFADTVRVMCMALMNVTGHIQTGVVGLLLIASVLVPRLGQRLSGRTVT